MGSVKAIVTRAHVAHFSDKNLVKTVKRTTYFTYALVVVVALLAIGLLFNRGPEIPDTAAEFTRLTRIEFFSKNFMTLWLTATDKDASALKEMLSDPAVAPSTWNSEPIAVADLNVVDMTPTSDGELTEWLVDIGVTVTAPGSTVPQRAYFAVTVIEKAGGLRALTLPRPINIDRAAVDVTPDYKNIVGISTPIGSNVANFVDAFYTQNASGSLGRYVSGNFAANTIAHSPYSSSEVLEIKSNSAVDAATADSGTTAALLVTIKAAISVTTFNTFTVPITVSRAENGQWLVDSIDDITRATETHVGVGN